MRSQCYYMFAVTLYLLVLCRSCYATIKALTDPTESIYFTKSADVAILGLFTKDHAREAKIFKQVAADLDAGIAYGMTTTAAVTEKYTQEDGAPRELPLVIAFNPFNSKTGNIKKGKKSKFYFKDNFEYAQLHEFALRHATPVVIRLPANDGPDIQKRNIAALRNMHPKMFMFSSKHDDAPDDYLEAAHVLYDRVLAFFVHVNTKVRVEEDGGASLMEGLKLDPKKLDKAGGTQVYVIYDKPFLYEGSLEDSNEMKEFLDDILRNKPEYHAIPSKVTWKKGDDEL